MTDTTTGLPLAGWYADPRVPRQLRWWDGTGWTNNVHMPDTSMADAASAIFEDGPDGRWAWPGE